MPGVGPRIMLLHAKAGEIPIRWFSPVEKRSFRPSPVNRMATKYIIYSCKFSGVNLPSPEYVSLDDAWKVMEFMAQIIETRGRSRFNLIPSGSKDRSDGRKRDLTWKELYFFAVRADYGRQKKEVTSVEPRLPYFTFTEEV
jgi:hypothetical protein